MMRLPPFRYEAPATLDEAARMLASEPAAAIVGGGTDLFPNMKRRHQEPGLLVSLRRIADLRGWRPGEGGSLRLGASVTLADLSAQASAPAALRRAAGLVATPAIRNVATLGGNLCLDTRCTYYDQNHEWREAIGFCMKKSGTTCWVAPSSDKCLAVSSTDCAPALLALGARVRLVGAASEREIALDDLYRDDGMEYLARRRDEILSDVVVPAAADRSTYWKLRRRGSIDFPVLSVAAALRLEGDVVSHARIVLGAVASAPRVADAAARILVGHRLTDELVEAAAAEAARIAKPMDNTDFQLHWRKAVAEPYVAGALRELRGDDPATFRPLARRAAAGAFAAP